MSTNEVGSNAVGPFHSKDSGNAGLELADDYPSDAVARGVADAYIVRGTLDELLTVCWLLS